MPLSLVRSLADRAAAHAPVVVGALRATALVEELMPALGARGAAALPPLRQLLARVHVAAAGGLARRTPTSDGCVPTGPPQDLTGLGPAPVGDELAARVDLLDRDRARDAGAGARRRAPWCTASCSRCGRSARATGVVARAVARLLLTTRGLDPTGSVVAESAGPRRSTRTSGRPRGSRPGSADGVARVAAGVRGRRRGGRARGAHDRGRGAGGVAAECLTGALLGDCRPSHASDARPTMRRHGRAEPAWPVCGALPSAAHSE